MSRHLLLITGLLSRCIALTVRAPLPNLTTRRDVITLPALPWLAAAGAASAAAGAASAAAGATSAADGAADPDAWANAGSWTMHRGKFSTEFFSSFKQVKVDGSSFAFKIVKEGAGRRPKMGEKVTVNFTGYRLNGRFIDTTYQREPFTFRYGAGKVMAGWEVVAGSMKPGSQVIVRIPAEYAYGEKTNPKVPRPRGVRGDEPLVFYMELVEVKR